MSTKWILLLTGALVLAAVSFGCAIAFRHHGSLVTAGLITPCMFLPVMWILAVTKWAFATDENAPASGR